MSRKIFSSIPNVKIVTGYTFDLVVLTTPWLVNKGEVKYIWKNKNNEFVKIIIEQIKKKYPKKIYIFEKKTKIIYLWSFLKLVRNVIKYIFLWESPIKGKILLSGYRSELPEITKIERAGGLVEVEWVQGSNFAARKKVFDEFKFNENLEKLCEYALNEDLEWSARVSKKYRIFVTSKAKLLHLRAHRGSRVVGDEKVKMFVISTYLISQIKGNKIAYLWSVLGLMLLSVLYMLINPKAGINRLKAVLTGFYERKLLEVN